MVPQQQIHTSPCFPCFLPTYFRTSYFSQASAPTGHLHEGCSAPSWPWMLTAGILQLPPSLPWPCLFSCYYNRVVIPSFSSQRALPSRGLGSQQALVEKRATSALENFFWEWTLWLLMSTTGFSMASLPGVYHRQSELVEGRRVLSNARQPIPAARPELTAWSPGLPLPCPGT